MILSKECKIVRKQKKKSNLMRRDLKKQHSPLSPVFKVHITMLTQFDSACV